MLDIKTFSEIIQNTPLISIDLIVKNSSNQVLLGKRVNEPAKDYWFVPGGRIYKDENLEEAYTRIVQNELSISSNIPQANFHGLYEHFYDNNVFNDGFSTHYIVLAHKLMVSTEIKVNNQHEVYKWFDIDELLNDVQVHNHTKNYFKKV
ncbi:GDP-mannose mannosyl hydrolase [bacterium]|nr:GDP-mannose mannosyl hydrolase [bacterium]MBU1957253.1 GDP-mannose mannosyl hydrolase [bacterium]